MPYAVAAKAKGIKVYQLNIGQPDIETPAEMLEVYHKYSERYWLMDRLRAWMYIARAW
jgi:aspartate aminotransferase